MLAYAIAGIFDETTNMGIYVGKRRYTGIAFMSSSASLAHFTRQRSVTKLKGHRYLCFMDNIVLSSHMSFYLILDKN